VVGWLIAYSHIAICASRLRYSKYRSLRVLVRQQMWDFMVPERAGPVSCIQCSVAACVQTERRCVCVSVVCVCLCVCVCGVTFSVGCAVTRLVLGFIAKSRNGVITSPLAMLFAI